MADNNKTQNKYQIINLYEQRLTTATMAAEAIGATERQFYRILNEFRKSGRSVESLKYKSHVAWNRTDENTEKKILTINKNYPDALNSHLSWLAWDIYGINIKPATARSILLNNGCYVPFKDKEQRAYKKFQATHFGALIQLDTSDGYWLKDYPMLHLILALDDASRTILSGGFYLHDSTLNNMEIIKGLISKYGIPALFYTDCDSKFRVIRHGKSSYQTYQQNTLDGETITEIRRALAEVGSGLITSAPFYPQSKGKVEKIFRFIQNCFIKNHRAKTLEELNKDFKKWIAWYDERNHRTLGVAPKIAREKLISENKVAFRSLDVKLNLDSILSIKDERKPNKYNIFSYQGKECQLPLDKYIYPGKVELRVAPDNKIRVFNKEKELIAELVN